MINDMVYLKFIKNKIIRPIYTKFFPSWIKLLKKEISDCDTVLDLGCGRNSPIQYCKTAFSLGVELFEQYLKESKKKHIHDKYINADVRKIKFESNSFDAVLALDILEHLTKEEGLNLIRKMEKWSKSKIIISTPNGFIWQDGYDDNSLQEHKSGWCAEELEKLGFKVYGMNGWKKLRGYKASLNYKPTLLWLIISNLTQKITYRNPKLAFQLFAIRQINKK